MKKSELVAAIAERTGYTKKEVIETLLPALEKVLTVDIPNAGGYVVRGKGKFEVKERKGRAGVNNLTGKPYDHTGETKKVLKATFTIEE